MPNAHATTRMESVSRQEIMIAYLCVIGTIALVLRSSRAASGRDDCGPPRGGQSEPAPPRGAVSAQSASSRGAVSAQSASSRGVVSAQSAFSRSAPILIGMGNGALGLAPSSAWRGEGRARARGFAGAERPFCAGDVRAHPGWDGWRAARRAPGQRLVRSDARERARGARDARGPGAAAVQLERGVRLLKRSHATGPYMKQTNAEAS